MKYLLKNMDFRLMAKAPNHLKSLIIPALMTGLLNNIMAKIFKVYIKIELCKIFTT